MKAIIFTLLMSSCLNANLFAQDIPDKKKEYIAENSNFIDLGFGFAKNHSSVTACIYHNWVLSKKRKVLRKIYIGSGIRFTSFYGKNIYFTSAPPSLYGTPANEDSLNEKTSFIYSVNALINFGYQFTNKLQVGFDIDAIGFSFGPKTNPTFISNGIETNEGAKPTPFNVLLVAANDRGTLNSSLYIRYKITEKMAVRASYHLLYTELTTNQKVQTNPELNDRFRHGVNLFGLGINYCF